MTDRVHVTIRWVERARLFEAVKAADQFMRDYPDRPQGQHHCVVYTFGRVASFAVWRTKDGVTVRGLTNDPAP